MITRRVFIKALSAVAALAAIPLKWGKTPTIQHTPELYRLFVNSDVYAGTDLLPVIIRSGTIYVNQTSKMVVPEPTIFEGETLLFTRINCGELSAWLDADFISRKDWEYHFLVGVRPTEAKDANIEGQRMRWHGNSRQWVTEDEYQNSEKSNLIINAFGGPGRPKHG